MRDEKFLLNFLLWRSYSDLFSLYTTEVFSFPIDYDLTFPNCETTMTSSIHDGHDALYQIDEKTDSSMAIDIEPSLIPILNRNDADEGNSKSSRLVQDSYSRKRCASRDSLVNHSSRTEMNLFTTKRQRNPDDGHATFFALPPLNESRRSSRLDIPSRNSNDLLKRFSNDSSWISCRLFSSEIT